jgi:nitrilase
MASGPQLDANLLEAERLIARAAAAGARLVVLPENFAFMGATEADKFRVAEEFTSGPIQDFLAQQAAKHRLWLVGGTVPLRASRSGKVRAACLVFSPDGVVAARYDKIHLFDVAVPDSDERYTESETIEAGSDLVVASTPFGRIGLGVCYDLRFPELFRALTGRGMDIAAIPSAFTAVTGRAHWEILVRARAIENLAYVVAAGQGGFHVNGRETYGHSMVVDPWGVVLGEMPRGSGVVTAEMDPALLSKVRRSFPTGEHRRLGCRME